MWFFVFCLFVCLFFPAKTFRDFPGGSEVKVSACNVGDLGLIPGCGCKELDTAERLHFLLLYFTIL